VSSEAGGAIVGTVSTNVAGAMRTIPVSGSFDPATSALRFSGTDFAFSGTFSGTSAKGTCTVAGTPERCSLKR
jgi:hypothetical protein